MEAPLAMVQCLNVLKLVRACMTREIHMVATVTSNRGNANRQVLQLHGTKTDSTVTTTDLETTADLHLHGQVAIVAATVMAATAARPGTRGRPRHPPDPPHPPPHP